MYEGVQKGACDWSGFSVGLSASLEVSEAGLLFWYRPTTEWVPWWRSLRRLREYGKLDDPITTIVSAMPYPTTGAILKSPTFLS